MIKTKVAFLMGHFYRTNEAIWKVFKKSWLAWKKLALQKATFVL